MEDEDFLLALQLQEQFDYEASTPSDDYLQYSKSSKDVIPYSRPKNMAPERPMSIVDESWEMIDPSPDVRSMFLEFNDMFFGGKLCGVEVKWSPRMTLCAGVCSYEGRGGLCSIRLSEPILKLRPRRDLVETLLHEMIHALLFVTQNNRDRDGHGPEFCKHMNRINQSTGTKISIYHSFHDEVDLYRQHWWRCNGPCQNRKPYFGYVKRAMNRAPSPRDPWWNDHQRTCGGTYTKIKEPEGYGKKGKANNKDKDSKPQKNPPAGSKPPGSKPALTSGSQDIRNVTAFSGKGFVLGGSSQQSSSTQKPPWQMPSDPTLIPPKPQLSSPSRSPAAKEIDYEPESNVRDLKKPSTSTVTNPVKKSVANHKAFVNINGSPVCIAKTNGHSTKKVADQMKTKLVFQDIFGDVTSPKKGGIDSLESPPKSRTPFSDNVSTHGLPSSSLDSTVTARPVSGGNPSASRPSSAVGSKQGFGGLFNPGLPKTPQKSGNPAPGSRKRPLDDAGSPPIYKFFKQSSSPLQRTEAKNEVASPAPSAGPTATQQSSSISIEQIMVNCPVCQAKVPEVEINTHLDACLSG